MGVCYGDYNGSDDAVPLLRWNCVDEPVRPFEGIEVHEVAGKYACYRLVGSYHLIPATFLQLYGD
jgi:hypothetical protein